MLLPVKQIVTAASNSSSLAAIVPFGIMRIPDAICKDMREKAQSLLKESVCMVPGPAYTYSFLFRYNQNEVNQPRWHRIARLLLFQIRSSQNSLVRKTNVLISEVTGFVDIPWQLRKR